MNMQVKTQSIHFTADQQLLMLIDEKVGKLQKYFNKINYVNVFLKLENNGQVRDKIVELKLEVPGEVIVVSESSKKFESAVEKATKTIARRLKRYKDKKYR